jgi:hypothetical protein
LVTKKTAEIQPMGGFTEHDLCCSVRGGSFKEGNCKVLLPQDSNAWICLSGTRFQREHSYAEKLADLLFAWEKEPTLNVSAPLELKGGGVDVSHVQQQLQNGANIIAQMLTGISNIKFIPVLVFQTISDPERRTLRKHPITFRGRRYEITSLKSGGSVASLRW